MLTRKNSSKIKLTKYLVVIPLTVALLVCCTNYSFSTGKETKGNKIYFKGNIFETNTFPTDLLDKKRLETKEGQAALDNYNKSRMAMVADSNSFSKSARNITASNTNVSISSRPIKMNGMDIMSPSKVTVKPGLIGNTSFNDFIFNALKPQLDKLEDADNYYIQLRNVIIDQQGKIVFYDVQGIVQAFHHWPADNEVIKIDPKINEGIMAKLTDIFESNLKFTPATINGKPVVCIMYPFETNDRIVVKNHVATLQHAN